MQLSIVFTDFILLLVFVYEVCICFLLREGGPLQVRPRRLLPARGLHEVLGVRRLEAVREGQVSGQVNHLELAERARKSEGKRGWLLKLIQIAG